MARIKAEGANTPADLLLTVDGGNLWQAEEMGILQPLNSQVVKDNIPAQYRSSSDAWTGLSLRARTIVYSPERVKDGELTTYEALADKNWEGRLCLRTSKKVYNQSLTATMIETHGAEKTEQILKGWVNNLATDVFADDNAVVMAVDAGSATSASSTPTISVVCMRRTRSSRPSCSGRTSRTVACVNLSGIGRPSTRRTRMLRASWWSG